MLFPVFSEQNQGVAVGSGVDVGGSGVGVEVDVGVTVGVRDGMAVGSGVGGAVDGKAVAPGVGIGAEGSQAAATRQWRTSTGSNRRFRYDMSKANQIFQTQPNTAWFIAKVGQTGNIP
jgi:hypothetical protein